MIYIKVNKKRRALLEFFKNYIKDHTYFRCKLVADLYYDSIRREYSQTTLHEHHWGLVGYIRILANKGYISVYSNYNGRRGTVYKVIDRSDLLYILDHLEELDVSNMNQRSEMNIENTLLNIEYAGCQRHDAIENDLKALDLFHYQQEVVSTNVPSDSYFRELWNEVKEG